MRKVILTIPDLSSLHSLIQDLKMLDGLTYEWTEQPENVLAAVGYLGIRDQACQLVLDKYQLKLY
jgi:hypothetical protein